MFRQARTTADLTMKGMKGVKGANPTELAEWVYIDLIKESQGYRMARKEVRVNMRDEEG